MSQQQLSGPSDDDPPSTSPPLIPSTTSRHNSILLPPTHSPSTSPPTVNRRSSSAATSQQSRGTRRRDVDTNEGFVFSSGTSSDAANGVLDANPATLSSRCKEQSPVPPPGFQHVSSPAVSGLLVQTRPGQPKHRRPVPPPPTNGQTMSDDLPMLVQFGRSSAVSGNGGNRTSQEHRRHPTSAVRLVQNLNISTPVQFVSVSADRHVSLHRSSPTTLLPVGNSHSNSPSLHGSNRVSNVGVNSSSNILSSNGCTSNQQRPVSRSNSRLLGGNISPIDNDNSSIFSSVLINVNTPSPQSSNSVAVREEQQLQQHLLLLQQQQQQDASVGTESIEPITLTVPRPENQRATNLYVDTPFPHRPTPRRPPPTPPLPSPHVGRSLSSRRPLHNSRSASPRVPSTPPRPPSSPSSSFNSHLHSSSSNLLGGSVSRSSAVAAVAALNSSSSSSSSTLPSVHKRSAVKSFINPNNRSVLVSCSTPRTTSGNLVDNSRRGNNSSNTNTTSSRSSSISHSNKRISNCIEDGIKSGSSNNIKSNSHKLSSSSFSFTSSVAKNRIVDTSGIIQTQPISLGLCKTSRLTSFGGSGGIGGKSFNTSCGKAGLGGGGFSNKLNIFDSKKGGDCSSSMDLSKSMIELRGVNSESGGSSRPPGVNVNSSAAVSESIICSQCGRCRCEACRTPKPPPSTWLCSGKCLCSAASVVECISCACCIKACLYHCGNEDIGGAGSSSFSSNSSSHRLTRSSGRSNKSKSSIASGSTDEDCDSSTVSHKLMSSVCWQPGKSTKQKCAMWTCFALGAIPLPCLLCYFPLTALRHLLEKGYRRCTSPGCRCQPPVIATSTSSPTSLQVPIRSPANLTNSRTLSSSNIGNSRIALQSRTSSPPARPSLPL